MDANKHLTRGKDRATGEWVVGYYIGESGGDAYIIEPSAVKYDVGSIDTSPVHECDPKTVGRFTGLQDFHSSDNIAEVHKDVYEGDILDYISYEGEDRTPVHYHIEVVWDDYTAAFRPKFLGKMDWRPLSSFCSGRVVGNKWDTPNLIDMKYR